MMPATDRQEALDYLTEPYEPVAQMTVELAGALGYIDDPDYLIVHPWGDESSAYLPFFIEPVLQCDRFGEFFYSFVSFDGQKQLCCGREMQVLVFRQPPLYFLYQ